MRNKIKILMLLAIISSTLMFFPAPQKAQAFLGVGDTTIVLIDLKAFFLELVKSFAIGMLDASSERFVGKFVNQALNNFKVGHAVNYARNLANQVYLGSQIKNETAKNQYIIRSIIDDYNGIPTAHQQVAPLYTQSAVQAFSLYGVNQAQPGPQTYAYLAGAANPASDPAYQKLLAQDKAKQANSQAQQGAAQDIVTSNNFKSTYNCPANQGGSVGQGVAVTVTDENGPVHEGDKLIRSKMDPKFLAEETTDVPDSAVVGTALTDAQYDLKPISNADASFFYHTAVIKMSTTSQTTQIAGQASCIIANPAKYITSTIDGQLSKLFYKEGVPSDHISAIARAIGQTLSKSLAQQLFNGSVNKSSLINDVATIAVATPGAITSQPATFQVFDSSGKLLGSGGDTVNIAAGTDVIFKWDATKVNDIRKVVFSFSNLQRDLPPAGTLPLTISTFGPYQIEAFGLVNNGTLDSRDTEIIKFAPAP